MRLSDLLGCDVVDSTGRQIGRVHEVRAVQTGPLQGSFGAALTLEGLIVGRGSIGTRLGFDRTDVRSPAVVRLVFEGMKGDRLYVPWDRIEAFQQHRINISGRAEDLRPPEKLPSGEQVDTAS
jgi:sporulation protein YlmC with PRC-barrel domain